MLVNGICPYAPRPMTPASSRAAASVKRTTTTADVQCCTTAYAPLNCITLVCYFWCGAWCLLLSHRHDCNLNHSANTRYIHRNWYHLAQLIASCHRSRLFRRSFSSLQPSLTFAYSIFCHSFIQTGSAHQKRISTNSRNTCLLAGQSLGLPLPWGHLVVFIVLRRWVVSSFNLSLWQVPLHIWRLALCGWGDAC